MMLHAVAVFVIVEYAIAAVAIYAILKIGKGEWK